MVTATIFKNSKGYCGFECSGHSGFAASGEDIVCSAISMLTINTANSILKFTDTFIDPQVDEGYISWNFDNEIDEKTTLLMDSLLLGLQTIEDTYDKRYLTLKIEEV